MKNLNVRRPAGAACLVLLSLAFVSGCAPLPGTLTAAAGTGVVYSHEQRMKYEKEVQRSVNRYIADHADSPCTHGEDRVMESAVKVLKNHSLTGYSEVMGRLETIYEDTSHKAGIRAAALYNMAVLQSRKLEPNQPRAREYFKRLYVEFPDHYRCIFADTEWRNSMIEKQLLYPGETVESFLKDAQEDVQKRQQEAQPAQ
jgi:hypothetical protein